MEFGLTYLARSNCICTFDLLAFCPDAAILWARSRSCLMRAASRLRPGFATGPVVMRCEDAPSVCFFAAEATFLAKSTAIVLRAHDFRRTETHLSFSRGILDRDRTRCKLHTHHSKMQAYGCRKCRSSCIAAFSVRSQSKSVNQRLTNLDRSRLDISLTVVEVITFWTLDPTKTAKLATTTSADYHPRSPRPSSERKWGWSSR